MIKIIKGSNSKLRPAKMARKGNLITAGLNYKSTHIIVMMLQLIITGALPTSVEAFYQSSAPACLINCLAIHHMHRCPFSTTMKNIVLVYFLRQSFVMWYTKCSSWSPSNLSLFVTLSFRMSAASCMRFLPFVLLMTGSDVVVWQIMHFSTEDNSTGAGNNFTTLVPASILKMTCHPLKLIWIHKFKISSIFPNISMYNRKNKWQCNIMAKFRTYK